MKSPILSWLGAALLLASSASFGAVGSDSLMRRLKGELVPHTLMIETALKTSKDEISGIRTQIQEDEVRKSPESVQNFKRFGQEIRADLHTITAHQAELKDAAQKYPQIIGSREFREASASLEDVKNAVQRWDQKSQSTSYWNNRQAVLSDLSALESRMDDALGKTRALNSSRLDFSTDVS